jgi:hypothetical protein
MLYKEFPTVYPGRYERNNSQFHVRIKGKYGSETTLLFLFEGIWTF